MLASSSETLRVTQLTMIDHITYCNIILPVMMTSGLPMSMNRL